MTVHEKYKKITALLLKQNRTITVMESCTGGFISSLITNNEGVSAIFKGANITYSNEAKIRAGVAAETIEKYGVYSPQTAAEMAQACKSSFGADIGIGVTGSFANTDPNNADSMPGQVHFAVIFDHTICRMITVAKSNRPTAKTAVADALADLLLHLLEES